MSSSKKKKAKKQTTKKTEQEPVAKPFPRRRRSRIWSSMFVPFALVLFMFGGTDALLLRNPWALTTALFVVAVLNWSVFFPVKSSIFRWSVSAILILVWFGAIFAFPPIRYSRETTYVTEPRKSNGYEIDYFPVIQERIHPPGTWSEPEKNGFRDFVSALGPATLELFKFHSPAQQTAYWKLLCEKLEIDAETQPPHRFQAAESFFTKNPQITGESLFEEQKIIEIEAGELKLIEQPLSGFQLAERLSNNPWTAEQSPLAKAWLDQNGEVLDLFAQSVRKEKFLCPLLRPDENQPLDTIVRWGRYFVFFNRNVTILVQYELGRGAPEKAWDHVLTQFLTAQQLFGQVCDVEDYFNAETIWSDAVRSAVAVVRFVANDSKGTLENPKDFLEQKVGELEPFFEPFSEQTGDNLLLGERLSVLEFLQAAAFGRNLREEMLKKADHPHDYDPATGMFKPGTLENDTTEKKPLSETLSDYFSKRFLRIYSWNEPLTKINRYFDEVELLKSSETAFAQTLFLRDTGSPWDNILKIGFLKVLPDKLGRQEIMIWIDKSRSLQRQLATCRAKSALMRCIFYLEMYKMEHSAYPNSLAQLEGQYGDKIPKDPCDISNRPLRYSLPTSDSYLLYSVGPNHTDDGGASPKQKKDADDVVL